MAGCEVKVEVTITNEKAGRGLDYALNVLRELREDMPWRDDVKRACRALNYARKNLSVEFIDDVQIDDGL